MLKSILAMFISCKPDKDPKDYTSFEGYCLLFDVKPTNDLEDAWNFLEREIDHRDKLLKEHTC